MTTDTSSAETMKPSDLKSLDAWIFKDRESLEQKFGMEMERVLEMYRTAEGKKELLSQMQKNGPGNQKVDAALDLVNKNAEQLQKKESFLKKMLMLPVRGAQAVGRTMKKHPVLTAVAGMAAIIALLYFLPAPAGVGTLRNAMIDGTKEILKKIGVGLPEAATDAVASVPVTGGPATDAVIESGAEIMQSPGAVIEHMDRLNEILPTP